MHITELPRKGQHLSTIVAKSSHLFVLDIEVVSASALNCIQSRLVQAVTFKVASYSSVNYHSAERLPEMFYSLIVLEVLWFAACSQAICSNISVCVANGAEFDEECQQHNLSHTYRRLTDITLEARRCRIIHIYLTSGVHILSENLDLADSVEETEIRGQLSTIVCLNNTGISFSESTTDNSVLLSNILLLHCHRSYGNSIQAALYFKYASYNLINMAIMSTEGYGLYADQCTDQLIFNTTFNKNSMGNIIIMFQNDLLHGTNVNIEIKKVKLNQGNSGQAMTGIRLSISHRVNCNLSITDCELHGGSQQLQVTARNYSAIMEVMVRNSIFNGSSIGARIQYKGKGAMMIIGIHDCIFRKNENTGLLISSATYVEIVGSYFSNNNNGTDFTYLYIEDDFTKLLYPQQYRIGVMDFPKISATKGGHTIRNFEH